MSFYPVKSVLPYMSRSVYTTSKSRSKEGAFGTLIQESVVTIERQYLDRSLWHRHLATTIITIRYRCVERTTPSWHPGICPLCCKSDPQRQPRSDKSRSQWANSCEFSRWKDCTACWAADSEATGTAVNPNSAIFVCPASSEVSRLKGR